MFPSTANPFVPKRDKSKPLTMPKPPIYNPSDTRHLIEQLDDEKYFLYNIIKAHMETCDYTKEKVAPLIEKARLNPIYARCSTLMACPLNPLPPNGIENGPGEGILENFSERFSPAIRGVVEFAKQIPGFAVLPQDDQVTLLKAGVFEVLLVRLACMFDKTSNSMICLNGMVLKRESLHSQSSARFLLDSMFSFAEMFNALNLSDHEIALFCALVIISPDRPGLLNIDLISRINSNLVKLLDKLVTSNHSNNPGLFNFLIGKISDLRTLNTLHSEKLLAFKMGPKNGQSCANGNSSTPSSTASSIVGSPLNGNSNSSSICSDRNSNSPEGNMINISCSYPSVCPVKWQNFTINDNDSSGPPSSISSSLSSSTQTSNNLPYARSLRHTEEESLSSVNGVQNVSSTNDNLINTRSVSSANGLNKLNTDYQHHHQQNNFILSQRLLQTANSSTSRNNNINNKNHEYPHNRYDDSHHSHHNYHLQDNYFISKSKDYSNGNNGNNNNNNNNNELYSKIRRVDSPTDSGIESGKEQCNGSTPTTSVCSSPRSACDDKVKDIVSDSESVSEKQESIDDMPMLKRALQAPPLINTNMLMDEAYRHHKKFRATKASRDCEPPSSSTSICINSLAPSPLNSNNINNNNNNNNNGNVNSSSNSLCNSLVSPTSTSSSSSLSSTSSSCLTSPTSNCDSLASTHSTLVKVLEQAPRYIGDLSHHYLQQHGRHHNLSSSTSSLSSSLSSSSSSSSSSPPHNNFTSMPPPLDLSRKRDLLYL